MMGRLFLKIKEMPRRVLFSLDRLVKRFPVIIFVSLLLGLVGLMVVGRQMRRPLEEVVEQEVKQVDVYKIGEAPRVRVNARIEKSGVVTMVAQTGGVVNTIYKCEGEQVDEGDRLVSLTNNYQGGNAMSVQRQLAEKNYNFNKDNFDLQKDIIVKNRGLAEQTDASNDELSRIADESLDSTRGIIDNSKDALNLVNDLIEGTSDESLLLGLKQQRLSLQNALSAAENGLRNAELTSGGDSPPEKLSNLQKEATLKQLELQEKTLELNLEVSKLNYNLALINESMMFPVAPVTGVVERVYVKVGQVVNPGQKLIVLSGESEHITAVANVSAEMAENVSRIEVSEIKIADEWWPMIPKYISTEPVEGRLFAVVYELGEEGILKGGLPVGELSDGEIVELRMPVGYADSLSSFIFVPVDAVYQSQDAAVVFVNNAGIAESREVILGDIYGRYVQMVDGLDQRDEVILDRNVIAGDRIEIAKN